MARKKPTQNQFPRNGAVSKRKSNDVTLAKLSGGKAEEKPKSMKTKMIRMMKWMLLAVVIAAVNSQFAVRSHAGLFKIDFGQLENEREILDADGNPTGTFPDILTDWDVIPTWTFADPNASVIEGSASIMGTANAEGTAVTWKLEDFSGGGDNDVTLIMMDNPALAEQVNPDSPPYSQGQTANNPTKEGLDPVYDGVLVPHVVKDDYLYRNPDTAATETLMRFDNLNPGKYNVTAFMGRTSDGNGRFGKVWVDDINGKNEPAESNTGDYGSRNLGRGTPMPLGNAKTVTVEVKAGQYLWFAEMEDNSGGISGLIVRSVAEPPPPPPPISGGLFKIDFGQLENERPELDADGNEIAPAPDPLTDWSVIPTWTFADPNASVIEGSASIMGTANEEATAVTWKLKDFATSGDDDVTVTITDNPALAEQVNPDAPPYSNGQTANNPTKENVEVVYDGVTVPAIVKDDYLYRNPDTAGTESLMRFSNLNPGKYNVTAFMGRTSDGSGRFGKVWVDDINGKNEPAESNTGDYGSRDLTLGAGIPLGQPKTVTVDIKAGEYLWFAEMEDNSGGISGLIIRGIASAPALIELVGSATVSGTYSSVSGATVDSGAKTITVARPAAATFYRVKGVSSRISINLSGGNLVIKYQ
ncbi:MAG: hypothetical protein HYY24_00570 [Verrucomicrobia bacterium]|nr:hypothetical protein [Verrucomicrobiota bacterium]